MTIRIGKQEIITPRICAHRVRAEYRIIPDDFCFFGKKKKIKTDKNLILFSKVSAYYYYYYYSYDWRWRERAPRHIVEQRKTLQRGASRGNRHVAHIFLCRENSVRVKIRFYITDRLFRLGLSLNKRPADWWIRIFSDRRVESINLVTMTYYARGYRRGAGGCCSGGVPGVMQSCTRDKKLKKKNLMRT